MNQALASAFECLGEVFPYFELVRAANALDARIEAARLGILWYFFGLENPLDEWLILGDLRRELSVINEAHEGFTKLRTALDGVPLEGQ